MNTLTDTLIPGNHGKIFGTNAIKDLDLLEIKTALMELDGIKDVLLNTDIFPADGHAFFHITIYRMYLQGDKSFGRHIIHQV